MLNEHTEQILEDARSLEQVESIMPLRWDLYKEAIAVKERQIVPVVGPSVDRRAFDRLAHVYNDKVICQLICFTGRCRNMNSIL